MNIADFFFGRKQNSSNKRRSADRTRNLRMEALEERALLSVTSLTADEYSALCAQYSEFNLPDMAELNVIVVDLDDGETALKLSDLKGAISTAGESEESDLILVKTTDSANTITYSSKEDELIIDIDSTNFGSITIMGLGTKPLTLDANQHSRVMTVSGENTIANLNGLTITKGMQLGSGRSSGAGIFNNSGTLTVTNCTILENGYTGGGISNNSGMLTVTNCTILGNNGYGIYNSDGTLKVINSAISENNGGGIDCFGQDSTITVTNCTFSENEDGGIFNISQNSTITVTNCIISENVDGGLINLGQNSTCTVIDCTISGNESGIYNSGTLTVTNCTISENEYSGIECSGQDSTLTVTNCTILENEGSGIRGSGTLTVTNCTISKNKGRGIDCSCSGQDSTLTVTDSTISENEGDGIDCYGQDSMLTVTNCTISENEGSGIGGSGTLTVTNCTISGNTADSGGGIFNSGALTVTNCTISGNTAELGGGIFNSSETGTVTINNSIVIDAIEKASGTISGSNNLTTYTDWSSGSNNLVYDSIKPLFVDAANGDYHLSTGSQAINKGSNALAVNANGQAIALDLDNLARIMYNTVDIGAYEYRDLPAPALSAEMTGIDSIKVTVGEVTNASGYTLEYSTSENFADAVSLDVSAGDASITGLSVNTAYYFRAMALGEGDYRDSEFCESTSATTDRIQVGAPTLTAATTGSYSIMVTVGEVENASGYTLEYSTSSDFADSTSQNVSAGETTIDGLNANTKYYFRVMAHGGGDYTDSDYCQTVSATTNRVQLTAPTLSASMVNSNSIKFTVGEVEHATEYTVEYATSSDFANPTSQNVSAGDASITGLNANTMYYFRAMALGEGDYANSDYSQTASATTDRMALTTPTLSSSVQNTTAAFTWDEVPNASGYQFEYKAAGAEDWTVENVEGTSISFDGDQDVTYTARVMALGVDDYTDSAYSAEQDVYINGAQVTINGKKVTVDWVDDSPAADSIRYRVAGTTKWTTKKLKAGVTSYTFTGKVGTNYEIEVLLDQQEVKTYNTTAVVLDQPKLKADKAALKDDTFQINVTNYAAKNLADNATQAIVTVNGVQTTLDIENQEGSAELTNGGFVAFNNGLFTFTEMNSNTSYKVQIAFSDGLSVSTASSALTVKTTKAPYLAPAIVSATAISDTSIVVEWETAYGKDTETPAQKYTVQYSLDGAKWTNATTGATGNSYTIQKLKGGNVYQVRVLATKDNTFLASDPSDVKTTETLALPKHTLDKTTLTDDSFTVNVSNYRTTNLPTATVVNIKSDKFGEMAINLENASGSATFGDTDVTVAFENGELTFANVPSNTQQKIQVNFSNGVCTTAWSAALTVKTTMAKYNKPILANPEALSSTSVLVEWTPVTGKSSPIEAQKYTVQYSLDGNKWTNATTSATGTSFTITTLKPNTMYLVAVIANKDANFLASDPSDSKEVTTL